MIPNDHTADLCGHIAISGDDDVLMLRVVAARGQDKRLSGTKILPDDVFLFICFHELSDHYRAVLGLRVRAYGKVIVLAEELVHAIAL